MEANGSSGYTDASGSGGGDKAVRKTVSAVSGEGI